MTVSYEEARAEATDYLAEADLHLARTGRLPSIPLPAELLRALLSGSPEPSEEEMDKFVEAINAAEKGISYSIELVRLVDNVETRRLTVDGERFKYTDGEDNGFDANQACYDHLNRVRKQLRIEAVRSLFRSRING